MLRKYHFFTSLRDCVRSPQPHEVRDRFLNMAAPPASTTVAISQLARPGALFEVEAIAVLPAKTAKASKAASSRRGAKSSKVKARGRKRR